MMPSSVYGQRSSTGVLPSQTAQGQMMRKMNTSKCLQKWSKTFVLHVWSCVKLKVKAKSVNKQHFVMLTDGRAHIIHQWDD